jgi:predicted AlkP superfamily phosphohydrolase/phosphomutase
MPSVRPRVLIVGVDGATFSLLAPWAEAGELPHFSRLMREGAWGSLESTIPPLTAPAWTSFMTGVNPGKHGLYHFISPEPGGYGFSYTNARTRKARTVWRILSDQGVRVGVVNVPMTFPPEAVNGFLISGLDTPDERSPFIYPADLREHLRKHFGRVRIDLVYLEFMRSDETRSAVLREMASIEDHRTRLAIHLMETFPVDVFMLVFGSVDQVQHYFWHYMDPKHPRHDARGASVYGDAIKNAYRKVDEKLGELLGTVPEGTLTILMSDHGAGPSSDTVLCLNQFLAELGVLQFRKRRRSLLDSAIQRLDPLLRSTLRPEQKARIAKLLPGVRNRWEQRLCSVTSIEWARTRAFGYEILPTYANLWVNLQGKFPEGIVPPGREYEALLDFLTEKLYDLRHPVTGRQLIEGIYRKSALYSGPYTEWAPDLTLSWWQEEGFSLRPSTPFSKDPPVRILEGGFDKLINQSGTHRMEGIFLLHGPPFEPGPLEQGARIVDLAPTLLYLMGSPIPEDMDGRVIQAAFRKDYLSAHPIRYAPPAGPPPASEETPAYSDEEAATIRQRLRSLGYME